MNLRVTAITVTINFFATPVLITDGQEFFLCHKPTIRNLRNNTIHLQMLCGMMRYKWGTIYRDADLAFRRIVPIMVLHIQLLLNCYSDCFGGDSSFD